MNQAIVDLSSNVSFSVYAIVVILIAAVLGFIIGLERELNGFQAGLRTHIIVSLIGCLVGVTGFYFKDTSDSLVIFAASIIAFGILAAFSIVQLGKDIKGMTTSTTTLLVGVTGLCCGYGLILEAIVVTIIALLVLSILVIFENKTTKADPYVVLYIDPNLSLGDTIIKVASTYGLKVTNILSKIVEYKNEQYLKVTIMFAKSPKSVVSSFAKALSSQINIKKIEVKPSKFFSK